MISIPPGVRVLVATRPVDFRKGAETLAAMAKETLGQDPFTGTVLVFRAKRADRIEIFVHDGGGLCLCWKALDEGAFKWPPITDGVMRLSRPAFLAPRRPGLTFAKSSEKLDPDQFQLALEDLEHKIAEVQAEAEKTAPDEVKDKRTRDRRQGRPSLPDALPEVHVTIEPNLSVCPCRSGALHRIGEDTSRRLDVIPVQYRRLVTHRPKYACRACEGTILQAPAPERLIPGGLPTEAMVACVVVGKYADHQPLYRQAQALARQGIQIGRDVLASWVAASPPR